MRFWDSSAPVSLLVREVQTGATRELFDQDPGLAVWWATRPECLGALARRARAGDLSQTEESEARARLSVREGQWVEVPPTEALRLAAERLFSVHPLRGADAFQLAAALEWCEHRPILADFVCFDARLREAAQREGFVILPEKV